MNTNKISDCTRIEQLIKNPSNRVVESVIGDGVAAYELRDAKGQLLYYASSYKSKRSGFAEIGFYNASGNRVELGNYYKNVLLFEMLQNKCAYQKSHSFAMASARLNNVHKR